MNPLQKLQQEILDEWNDARAGHAWPLRNVKPARRVRRRKTSSAGPVAAAMHTPVTASDTRLLTRRLPRRQTARSFILQPLSFSLSP